MKIRFKEGNKCEGDRLFSIETKGEEFFNHSRLLILINELSRNEWLIYKKGEWDKKGKDFLFPLAINEAIELGKLGISFLEDNNEIILKEFCQRNHLKFEKFKQTKLEDFINGKP